MAQNETPITLVGNVASDIELRFTPSGTAVANFRIASTPRVYNRDTNQHEDGESLFLTVNAWKTLGENAAASLAKGMRVVVTGVLKQRSYQNKEGENRTVYEVEADEIGPALRFATAQVQRSQGGGGNNAGSGNFNNQQPAQNDPWGGGQPNQGGFGGQQAQGQQAQNQGGFGGQQAQPQPNQGGFGGQQPQNQGGYNPAQGGFAGNM